MEADPLLRWLLCGLATLSTDDGLWVPASPTQCRQNHRTPGTSWKEHRVPSSLGSIFQATSKRGLAGTSGSVGVLNALGSQSLDVTFCLLERHPAPSSSWGACLRKAELATPASTSAATFLFNAVPCNDFGPGGCSKKENIMIRKYQLSAISLVLTSSFSGIPAAPHSLPSPFPPSAALDPVPGPDLILAVSILCPDLSFESRLWSLR